MVEPQSTPRGARILIVDDNPTNLKVLLELLEAANNSVMVATRGQNALHIAVRGQPDIVLLDVVMPEMDGYEVCRRLKQTEETAGIPVIFLTGRDRKEDVIAGFRAGGVDYITKPFQEEEVLSRVETHVRLSRLATELQRKNAALAETNRELELEIVQRKALKGRLSMISEREAVRWGLEDFVGQSATIQRIFKEIHLMQDSPMTSVLITGESGTGKELIARAIHFGGARQDGPFVPVNCAAIPADLVESALFGHNRGSFTGASDDRLGFFEIADGGTLFLDEIADMPLELQSKLLRVLEDGVVWRIGATEGKKVAVRVLAATNVELQQRLQAKSFRQDLYYRLARFTVTSPPLRERTEDIPILARHFLKLFAEEMGREVPDLSLDAVEILQRYRFPGNVRELKNLMERALIESGGVEVLPHHLHFLRVPRATTDGEGGDSGDRSPGAPDLPLDLDRAVRCAEKWVVGVAMQQSDGNVTKAARQLGTSRNRLYRVLRNEVDPADLHRTAAETTPGGARHE